MDEKELQAKIEKGLEVIHEFKAENDAAIKNNTEKTGEHESKLEKMAADVVKIADLEQKYAELKKDKDDTDKKLEELSIATNASIDNSQSKKEELKIECSEAFGAFVRKQSDAKESFAKYLLDNGKEHLLKSMSVNRDDDGGWMVLPEQKPMEKTLELETSPMRAIARVTTTSSDAIEFVVRDGASVGATAVGETETRSITGTRSISKKRIDTHEICSRPLITQKMMDDAGSQPEQMVMEDIREDFALFENASFYTGLGVKSARGILTYDNWTTPSTYQKDAIEQIVSGAPSDFTADGIINLEASLKTPYRPNAVFQAARTALRNIMRLQDGNGNYLFNRDLTKNSGSMITLLGKPLLLAEDMPTVASNSLSLAYGDFRRGYMIVDRIGIRVLRDPYNNIPYIGFYTTKRYGGDVYNFEAIKIQKISA